MLFNSLPFLVFFPLTVFFYFIVPCKLRWLWLLFASYFFYMAWNPLYGFLLFTVTFITWIFGVLIGVAGSHNPRAILGKKLLLAAGIIFTLFLLFYFKYADFAVTNIAALLALAGITVAVPAFDIVLPVGISFYTFQALGYMVDVYRGDTEAEKNLARHALFISFFPQLLAGPIGRAEKIKAELFAHHRFNYEDARYGLLLMLWGYFQKMMIADQAAVLVSSVYDIFYYAAGYQIVLATLLFAVQVYCDFAAYSLIALGAARVMGIRLTDNFRQPYLAVSVKDFWHRWHISLSTWFRDYLYIPLGGSRCSRPKKYRNIMVTFLASGLWHGASLNFLAWGALHGFCLIAGDFSLARRKAKVRSKECDIFQNGKLGSRIHNVIRILTTFALVSVTWIFFRADGIMAAIHMIRRIFTSPLAGQINEKWFLSPALAISIVLLIVIDLCREKLDIFNFILKQNALVRWTVYYALVLTIIVLGIYGTEYVQTQFIYFDF